METRTYRFDEILAAREQRRAAERRAKRTTVRDLVVGTGMCLVMFATATLAIVAFIP